MRRLGFATLNKDQHAILEAAVGVSLRSGVSCVRRASVQVGIDGRIGHARIRRRLELQILEARHRGAPRRRKPNGEQQGPGEMTWQKHRTQH